MFFVRVVYGQYKECNAAKSNNASMGIVCVFAIIPEIMKTRFFGGSSQFCFETMKYGSTGDQNKYKLKHLIINSDLNLYSNRTAHPQPPGARREMSTARTEFQKLSTRTRY
jgi:hypothetical protein